jgi:hypothetical protein
MRRAFSIVKFEPALGIGVKSSRCFCRANPETTAPTRMSQVRGLKTTDMAA